ncbi:hypothetical protein SORBI_3008G178701 [Sorghum bicolor]|uniref:Uncharacterized protein n=1 Tax=Sorghum bicolor TaxID=4558 RepID=A0A1Z5R7E2_SORBI|nr:hypothetical protein SORBI_3008G178701 [Sorghum bicolor]
MSHGRRPPEKRRRRRVPARRQEAGHGVAGGGESTGGDGAWGSRQGHSQSPRWRRYCAPSLSLRPCPCSGTGCRRRGRSLRVQGQSKHVAASDQGTGRPLHATRVAVVDPKSQRGRRGAGRNDGRREMRCESTGETRRSDLRLPPPRLLSRIPLLFESSNTEHSHFASCLGR